MRLWTIHPQHLDAKGSVALWRESLLAQKVLLGETKGYKHHPQLLRFRSSADPIAAIAAYLNGVLNEAKRRGYSFDASRIVSARKAKTINVTNGQLLYEWSHLKRKLRQRDLTRFKVSRTIETPDHHPLFRIVAGDVESWERTE